MALQGTIDVFPLTDVLTMIGSSQRSGRLVVDGDRGRSVLWIESGDAVATDPTGEGREAPAIVATMLRNTEASFEFDTREKDPTSVELTATSIVDSIAAAEKIVEKWVAIERIVPSPAHRIAFAAEIATALTVSPDEWALLSRCGSSPAVERVGADLELDDFTVNSRAAALVERGLLVVEEPSAVASSAAETASAAPTTPHTPNLNGTSAPENVQDAAFPDHFPIDDLVGGDRSDSGPDWATTPTADPTDTGSGQWPDPTVVEPAAAYTPLEEPWGRAEDSSDEVMRQMANLSPKAAEAIAEALNTSDADPVPAPDGWSAETWSPEGETAWTDDDQDQWDQPPTDPPGNSVSYLQSF